MDEAEPPRQMKLPRPPAWARPDCADVDDLSRPSPLRACKMRAAGQRVGVRSGYGQPRVYRRPVAGAESSSAGQAPSEHHQGAFIT